MPVSNRYELLEEKDSPVTEPPDSSTAAAASATLSTTVSEQLLSASRQASTKSTIVARGQVDGVQCVDMLIDTGASCCFVRRSWAENHSALCMAPLKQHVTVTMADKRTAVSTHEVRASCMSVHGSKAACTLLVMDELSNDVIVGLSWQRAARLAITPGYPHDLLNGRPVHDAKATVGSKQPGTKPLLQPAPKQPVPDEHITLYAALVHALAGPKPSSAAVASQRLASIDEHIAVEDSDQLRQVLRRHQRVFTAVLPVKTAEQIAQARQFSIVLIGDAVRPVKQFERRVSPAEYRSCHPVGAR